MANPAIVASNTGNYVIGSLTSVTVASSGTPKDGDVVLVALAILGSIVEPGVISAPTGWQLAQQNLAGVGSLTRVAVFYKIASGESGSYVFSWANISSVGLWIVVEYAGGDTDAALNGAGDSQQNALSVNAGAPSLTPATWNNCNTLVCIWTAEVSALNIMSMSAPAGMTLQAQSKILSIGFPALMLADVALTSNAPTGTKTAATAFATTSIGISLLIKQSIWADAMPHGGIAG